MRGHWMQRIKLLSTSGLRTTLVGILTGTGTTKTMLITHKSSLMPQSKTICKRWIGRFDTMSTLPSSGDLCSIWQKAQSEDSCCNKTKKFPSQLLLLISNITIPLIKTLRTKILRNFYPLKLSKLNASFTTHSRFKQPWWKREYTL